MNREGGGPRCIPDLSRSVLLQPDDGVRVERSDTRPEMDDGRLRPQLEFFYRISMPFRAFAQQFSSLKSLNPNHLMYFACCRFLFDFILLQDLLFSIQRWIR